MKQPETLAPSVDTDALRKAVETVCKAHPVARVELFGSMAEGHATTDSDVDLLVEFLPGSRVGLLEMGEVKEQLEERLGRSVDLVSRQAVERSRNPYRRRAILAAPVPIYAR